MVRPAGKPDGQVMGRSGKNIEPATMARIADECQNVVMVKEATGSLDQASQILATTDLTVLSSGDDSLTLHLSHLGQFTTRMLAGPVENRGCCPRSAITPDRRDSFNPSHWHNHVSETGLRLQLSLFFTFTRRKS